MSDPRALQRVVVRMLFDEALVEAIHQGDPWPGPRVELDPEELSWLKRVDRRAWGVDVYRRPRTLMALLEEFPATASLASERDDAFSRLDRYFGSRSFHGELQNRGSLALSFGAWCKAESKEGRLPATAGPIAAIEREAARLRRVRGRSSSPLDPGHVRRQTGVGLLSVQGGSLEHYGELLAWVESSGGLGAVLSSGAGKPTPGKGASGPEEHLLFTGEDGGIACINSALYGFLHACAEAITVEAASDLLGSLGAEDHEAPEILRDLETDGLIDRG